MGPGRVGVPGWGPVVAKAEHTFGICIQICERSYVRAGHTNFGGRHCLILLSCGPFRLSIGEPTLSAIAEVLHFPFKNLTQNQERYWPNSDPKSQPLCMSLLQSRP
jgi:hypothetical protein